MPGLASFLVLLAFCAAVVYFDLRFGRIPNALNAAGLISGSVASLATFGLGALILSLTGALLGLAIMLVPFLLNMVGGGDVKFLAAAGSIVGVRMLWPSFLAGAALGGITAGALLVLRELSISGLRRRLILLIAGLPHGDSEGRSGGSVRGDLRMPYAVPLSIGLVTMTLIHCCK